MPRTHSRMCWLTAMVAAAAVAFSTPARPCTVAADCLHHAQQAGAVSVELRLGWRPVGAITLDAAGQLQFPDVPGEPGIYRFDLRGEAGQALYIGETSSLRRRFYQYRRPGKRQATNHRICTKIRQVLASGGSVEVSLGKDAWFCAAAGCAKADLASANQRRLLEQLAIFSTAPGIRVLNSELTGRRKRSAVDKFSLCS